MNSLRELYLYDNDFKDFVDTLDIKQLDNIMEFIKVQMKLNNDKKYKSVDYIRKYIDSDLICTIKDRLQPDLYMEFDEKKFIEILKEIGMVDIKRLTRYVYFNNVRRFLAPFYNQYQHKYSRLLYGDGAIQIRCFKK